MSSHPEHITTADGSPYRPEEQYFFWHSEDRQVRSTDDYYRETGFIVDQMDRRIVPLGELHRTRDGALEAAQKLTLRQIETLKALVEDLENQKSPDKRCLKYRLMARQH